MTQTCPAVEPAPSTRRRQDGRRGRRLAALLVDPDRPEAGDIRPIAGRHLAQRGLRARQVARSEEHTSELQSLMRTSYAVFCLKKKTKQNYHDKKKNNTKN